jgi:hypothetical protein
MAKWLLILVLPLASLALAGCITEQNSALPMALAPSDSAQTICLTYGDTPAYGCKAPGAVSLSQDTK